MKKIIVIFIAVAVLITAGVFGFYKIRDVFTDKMMSQLQNDEEAKKYADEIKKKAEGVAEEIKEKSEKEEEEKTEEEEKKEAEEKEKAANSEKKPGGFWDEPLVKSVYARYSASEIATVSSMAAGGFNPEEKSRAKAIVFSKMSSSEFNQILQLYNKYN